MEDTSNVLIFLFLACGVFFAPLVFCLRTFIVHYRAQLVETARQHQHQLQFAGTPHGLTPSAISGIPTFAFKRDSNGWAQCAICLSFLEEAEMVRQLPGCKHIFHLECIDMWLNSHATCPLCRSLVSNANAGKEKDLEAQISASDVGATVQSS